MAEYWDSTWYLWQPFDVRDVGNKSGLNRVNMMLVHVRRPVAHSAVRGRPSYIVQEV